MPVSENFNQILKETAAGYLQLGWSVVPLWGDTKPEQAKVAAVTWSTFQRRRATEAENQRWFSQGMYAGLGIVVGAVSGLVVLDFDSHHLITAFERELPELAATRSILTRRGRHLYFRIPPNLHVANRKLNGVDLLSDGHYVVAPPTVIDGHEYRVGQGGQPKTLDHSDIQRITRFLDQRTRAHAVTSVGLLQPPVGRPVAIERRQTQEGAFYEQDERLLLRPGTVEPDKETFLTAEALVRFYRALVLQAKRNVALFRTSCIARDHGWKMEAIIAVLASVHADELPASRHPCENRNVRYREAIRTIRSAFSKPPRPPRSKDTGGLFNSIREKLLQLGQTCVVRVLEGLRLAGFNAGQLVSEQTVLRVLKGLVGRHSVRRAFAAQTPSNQPIFEKISPLHPPRGDAAERIRIDRQNNAYVNRSKPDSIRGRQEHLFRIPSQEALCCLIGVAPSGSDPIALDDLQTAKKTRQALHRGLIQRRPGLYLRKWLGDRLGVSETTIWRYCRQTADVHTVATFTQTPLRWDTLNAIPAPDVAPGGTCLEDSTGKRWPALKGIAQKLLAQGRGVRLLVRSLNYYWCGPGDPPVSPGLRIERTLSAPTNLQEPVVTFAQRVQHLVREFETRPRAEVSTQPPPPPAARVSEPRIALPHSAHYTKRKLRRRYWQPFDDTALEALALRTYQLVNGLTSNPDDKVSLVSVRRWVDQYGESRLQTALALLTTRRNIQKPAAFVATTLPTLELR